VQKAFKIYSYENVVNMKVLLVFKTNNFAFYMILIRDRLLSKKGSGVTDKFLTDQLRKVQVYPSELDPN
jgi:hypothetical protein